jgi:SIT4-associating protein SAP185/190
LRPELTEKTFQSTSKDEFDDDDAWGSFTSVTTDGNSENPFGDDAFAPSSSSKSDSFRSAEPLTPRDWAEAFDREFDSEPQPWNEDTDEVQAIVMPDDDAADVDVVTTPTSSWSFPGDESDDLGEDLPPASTTVGTSTPPDIVSSVSRRAAGLHLNMPRRNSISQNAPPHIPTPEEEREDALAAAATPQHPLGPGVSADTHVEHGMLERTMEDGTVVRVPEDDIVRGVEEAIERRVDSESE